ncbi:hypothetical protein VDG1235_4795 [Verrucomicrobiia bacterium DG1235]|nr:hypothetical protein VDG1235_4795 [Verrucomicrobiae bacterium DG1235]
MDRFLCFFTSRLRIKQNLGQNRPKPLTLSRQSPYLEDPLP